MGCLEIFIGMLGLFSKPISIFEDYLESMKKVFCLVGMPGSGKSAVARILSAEGYRVVRTGDVTDDEAKKQGLELNEVNERKIREGLRKLHGDDVYAKLSHPKFGEEDKIAVDGVYNEAEWEYWAEKYPEARLVALISDTGERHNRLVSRNVRPMDFEDAKARDEAQLVHLGMGKVLDRAHVVVENNGSYDELKDRVLGLLDV